MIKNFTSILAGDMNATPDSEPMKVLYTHWTNAIDEAATPTSAAKTRIDSILYRPASRFRVVRRKVIGCHRSQEVLVASRLHDLPHPP